MHSKPLTNSHLAPQLEPKPKRIHTFISNTIPIPTTSSSPRLCPDPTPSSPYPSHVDPNSLTLANTLNPAARARTSFWTHRSSSTATTTYHADDATTFRVYPPVRLTSCQPLPFPLCRLSTLTAGDMYGEIPIRVRHRRRRLKPWTTSGFLSIQSPKVPGAMKRMMK